MRQRLSGNEHSKEYAKQMREEIALFQKEIDLAKQKAGLITGQNVDNSAIKAEENKAKAIQNTAIQAEKYKKIREENAKDFEKEDKEHTKLMMDMDEIQQKAAEKREKEKAAAIEAWASEQAEILKTSLRLREAAGDIDVMRTKMLELKQLFDAGLIDDATFNNASLSLLGMQENLVKVKETFPILHAEAELFGNAIVDAAMKRTAKPERPCPSDV